MDRAKLLGSLGETVLISNYKEVEKQRANLDRFEKEPIDFHNRIRNIYKSRAKEDSNRIKIVDSSVSFKEVKAQVVYIISQFLNE